MRRTPGPEFSSPESGSGSRSFFGEAPENDDPYVYDFDALKPREDNPAPGSLAELIAEERRALQAAARARAAHDERFFAWRDAECPDWELLSTEERLEKDRVLDPPESIAALRKEADSLDAAAAAATDRVLNWTPHNSAASNSRSVDDPALSLTEQNRQGPR